jgi:UPF0176 protein
MNGTLCSTREIVDAFHRLVHSVKEFSDTEFKESLSSFHLFKKMYVKIKKEIVTFKVPDLDMSKNGKHLTTSEWNDMLNKPDIMVIDTRNTYEVSLGSFKNAINPQTENFGDFAKWAEENLSHLDHKQPIAMFCTGGVRCEKSTAYLKQRFGFENVYHLKGGILKYLEEVKKEESLWQGNCFVFDYRLAVDHQLRPMVQSEE